MRGHPVAGALKQAVWRIVMADDSNATQLNPNRCRAHGLQPRSPEAQPASGVPHLAGIQARPGEQRQRMDNSRKFSLPACLSAKGQSGGPPRCPQAAGSAHRHTYMCTHRLTHIHTHACAHTCTCAHTYTRARTHTSSHMPFWKVRHPDSHFDIMGSLLFEAICPSSRSRRDGLLHSAHPHSCTEGIPFEAFTTEGTVNLEITGNCHGGNFKLRLHWKTRINSSANCILKRITI